MKTVAYIEDRAVGLAALVPLACRDIVLEEDGAAGRTPGMLIGRRRPRHD